MSGILALRPSARRSVLACMNWYFLIRAFSRVQQQEWEGHGDSRDHLLEALEHALDVRSTRDVVVDLIHKRRKRDASRVGRRIFASVEQVSATWVPQSNRLPAAHSRRAFRNLSLGHDVAAHSPCSLTFPRQQTRRPRKHVSDEINGCPPRQARGSEKARSISATSERAVGQDSINHERKRIRSGSES